MRRLIFGPMLAILLLLTVLTSAQENPSVLDSSAQASLDGGVMMPAETAGGQDAAFGAKEMDQMIQTIESDSSGISGEEEAPLILEIPAGTDDASQTGQVADTLEDDSSSSAGADQTSDTVEEAKEMDQMIQTIEANGSTNAGVDQSAGASSAGGEGATDQSVSIGISSGEKGGNVPTGAGQDSGTLNQTKSADQMDQMIQTLVESDGNNTSETGQGIEPTNGTETAEQSIQMSANGEVTSAANVAAAEQTEIQEKTESMGLLIQTLANNETSTGMTTTKSTETTGTIEKTRSIDQAIQTLEDYGDGVDGGEAAGSNEVASGLYVEIVDEGNSMDKMIQALEGSDI